jgi:hypothetical protein
MSQLNSINPSAAANQVDTNPIANGSFYVPCVPIAVSANLVAAQPLAKRLAASASELAHLSHADFASIQLNKSELRLKVNECAMNDEALLDVCMLNVEDLFANLSAYLMIQGQVAENSQNDNLQINLQVSLKQVHAYAAAMGFVAGEYWIDGVMHPEMLFEACLKRVQALQKRWQDNYFQSMDLALQQQRDAVYSAAASCLMEICQNGLDNQISLEPTPQAQEDVLVALDTFVDAPFCGAWPVLRQRVIVLGHENTEGGVQ